MECDLVDQFPLEPVIVRLAHEGVPVRAIARATKVESADIRLLLAEAVDTGQIVSVPRDDWPPQVARDQRVPEYSKGTLDEAHLILNIVRLFAVTQQEARILLVLIKRREATRNMLHGVIESRRPHPKTETEPKIVDVVICKLRKKLKAFDLSIVTVWSCGYFMIPEHRQKALGMLNTYLEDAQAVKIED